MVQLGHGSLQGSLATVWIQSNSISNFQQGGSISHAPYNPQCNAEMSPPPPVKLRHHDEIIFF